MDSQVDSFPRKLEIHLKGRKECIVLGPEPLSLGRSPDNDITLADPRISRFHLRIEPVGPGHEVIDLGSQNGTWRNGKRVKSAILEPGDVVKVGSALLLYDVLKEGESSASGFRMRRETSTTTRMPQVESTGPEASLRSLRPLKKIMRALDEKASDEEFFRGIMDAALEMTGSERGFLIRSEKEGMVFAAARNMRKEDLSKPDFELSWSIAIRVGTTGESILAVDASSDERFRSLESVEALGLRSVMCVPVRSSAGILGVIYVDNRLRNGAYGEEHLEVLEMLAGQAGIMLHHRRLESEVESLRREVADLTAKLESSTESVPASPRLRPPERGDDVFSILVGGSARMEEVRDLLRKVAATDFFVLIQGESGTGKELAARAVHMASKRRKRPFVTLNCGAMPETLLENELFGHARGAYTGADQKSSGLFVQAHGGTLFLDEVSEMSPALQKRLLRVLQEGELRPVGGKETVSVDVRIVAASNRDLGGLVRKGSFREDLYYRLKVLPVNLPPLRSRREDIPDLLAHFFGLHGKGGIPTISPEAMDILCSYAWPGNVRELENEVKRLLVLAGERIEPAAISRHILEAGEMLVGGESSFHDLGELVSAVETKEIRKALDRSGGNKTKAAALLGISRFTLQRKLEKYGLISEVE